MSSLRERLVRRMIEALGDRVADTDSMSVVLDTDHHVQLLWARVDPAWPAFVAQVRRVQIERQRKAREPYARRARL